MVEKHMYLYCICLAALQSVRCTHFAIDDNPDAIKKTFTDFIMELLNIIQEKQEKEEQGIVGKRKN